MGYDKDRFIGVIQQELVCSICTMVLQNPVLSGCEHMFCNSCMQSWIERKKRCPQDRKLLSVDQQKSPDRVIHSLLNKLIIKCDFYREGCNRMVMLEFLEDHRDKCEFNPNVSAASGTNNKIKIEANNFLNPKPIEVVEDKSGEIAEGGAQVKEEIVHVEEKSAQEQEGNAQLKTVRVNSIDIQQPKEESAGDNIPPFAAKFENNNTHEQNAFVDEPNFIPHSKWQVLHNFETKNEMIQVRRNVTTAFAQSASPISPSDPSFKVKLVDFCDLKYLAFGLSCTGHEIEKIPGLCTDSVAFDSAGDFLFNRLSTNVGRKWCSNDVIECGIRFPDNYTSSERGQTKIYLSINGTLVIERKVPMPTREYFPTIYAFEGISGSWWDKGVIGSVDTVNPTKLKYFK